MNLVRPVQDMLWLYGFVFLRLSAMMALLPLFGERSVPVRVRLGVTFAFCLVVSPVVAPLVDQPATFEGAIAAGGAEVVTGLVFGALLRFFIFALQVAGTIAAQSTSLSQIFGGSAGVDPQPAIGHVLVVAGLALAALMGLHLAVAEYMINSYALVAFGRLLPGADFAEIGAKATTRAFTLGFTLAAPFVIASLLYNVILGVINKAMPQLMVSFVGAPAITAGGLLILCLTTPLILSVWVEAFGHAMASPGADF
ncbi:MAG: flagellar biosynthetic protein FliR [Loktanella sp.]|nr:flagellar biosynthetic protein FliR [Loktanella sp.]